MIIFETTNLCHSRDSNHECWKLIKTKEKKWLGYWLTRHCLLKDALEETVNGRKIRGRRQYQMIDNITINGQYEDTRRKNNTGTDKEEEEKLAGLLAKKELPAEGCSRF